MLPLHRKKPETTDALPSEEEPAVDEAPAPAAAEPSPAPTPAPVLASELLREQMRPSAPGAKTLQRMGALLGGLGILAISVVGGLHPLTYVCLAALAGILVLSVAPLSYTGRALSLLLLGGVTSGLPLWEPDIRSVIDEGVLLAGSTILLGGSLLFRAYYRGARLARVAVTMGVLALAAWFFLSDGHRSLVTVAEHWQSWAPATTHVAFGLIAVLSLLAFMESSTRGGSHVWAYSLLTLYALHVMLLLASAHWPVYPQSPAPTAAATAAMLAGIVGTVIAAMALAQVFVVASRSAKTGSSGRSAPRR